MNIKAEQKQKVTLPSPLFRDPIYDCPATDPTVIWNEEEQWYLLYTQRRATMFRSVCPGCMEQPLALQQAGMAQNGCTTERGDLILSRDRCAPHSMEVVL